MEIDDTNLWIRVNTCPLCSCKDSQSHGLLPIDSYQFGKATIPLPHSGIEIKHCKNCGLVFKDLVPSEKFITDVFNEQAGNVWCENYNYKNESYYITNLIPNNCIDLLDVGPSDGRLLKALKNVDGRKSGLDVIKHPGLDQHLDGEFINYFIDHKALSWSGDKYDIITAYDVFEHLYNPASAFINLQNFLKEGGFIIIETGDINSYWAKKYNVNQWWYLNLFEHHIFWSHDSIKYAANKYGFKIFNIAEVRHKSWAEASVISFFVALGKSLLWRSSRSLYRSIYRRLLGRETITLPRDPLTKDHILAILQKKS